LRPTLVASATAAVVDVGLAAILVPLLDAIGAATANVAGLIAYTTLVATSAMRFARPVTLEARTLTRGSAAAVVSGGVGWVVLDYVAGVEGLVAACGAVLGVYAVLARTLRVVPYSEAIWLEHALGPRLGAAVGRACRFCAAGPSQ
jgi:O-antigen/teichoic acid export membrane protein